MTSTLLQSLCAYIPRDRVESILHPGQRLSTDGVALIADISGFTPLTEALTHGLSPDHGAEELTRALTGVFTPLIHEIHAFRGSVIKFGGDALIVWFGREPGARRTAVIRRALTSAWRMQRAIERHGQIPTPIGVITLKMKVGLTYGPVKRFNLGLPRYGYEDVLGGQTLDRMAEAEHHAEPGDIVLDRATLAYLPEAIEVAAWRDDFAVIGQLLQPARPRPWPPLDWPPLAEEALIELLQTYVPGQIYETLAASQAQVAELKPVVSLFVQFHGIDYDHDPEVGWKLQIYFVTGQQIVARYGGRLNRLITGDKGSLLHIIFGAPRTVEEQEARAIRCALDLQRECGRLPFITMQRIGVSVGRVFAGPVGSSKRHDFTTMGDSINLSARLMQNAADHQILMEAAVRQQLGSDFQVEDLGQIMVKGKAAPIPVFAATGAVASTERRLRTQKVPIFGREEELDQLTRRFADLAAGRGGVVTLVGEVGMGKTHILTALRARLAQAATPIRWAEGMCLAYGQTLSGYLFIDILRDLINLPPDASPGGSASHLLNFCRNLFGETRLEATYPYLARFMNLPLEAEFDQRLAGLSGENLRWQFFEVFSEMLERLLEQTPPSTSERNSQPLILALDDLQWADPTSIQLLEAILPLSATRPLLLLLAMRPDHDSRAWALRSALQARTQGTLQLLDITLSSLSEAAARTLIANDAPNLPDEVIAYLVDKSGGNPLFLVELVHTMQIQGLLVEGVDARSLTVAALDLPNSVQGLLLAQIDRLAVEARHTLQMASVIGRTFLFRVLENLAVGEQDLNQRLLVLEERDYIRPDDPTDLGLAFIFRHALIQESAYGTLLYERRRAYHHQVAQILERLFPTQIAEQAGLLAYHYEQAEDLEQAIYFHLQAADQARLIYANEEAEMLYQKVLKLLEQQEALGGEPDLDRRARTYLKIAQVRSNTLDFQGAQEFYELAFDLLEKLERSQPASTSQSKGDHQAIRLGVLEYGPTTLDPGLAAATDISEIVGDLFEGLVELDSELNIIPAMARRWQIYEDGRKYRFELHPDLKWSDGQPLTAHDFVFAWRRNLQPETAADLAHLLDVVQGAEAFQQGQTADPETVAVTALDDLHLEVTLKIPAGYFLYLLARPITFPQPRHIVRDKGADWSTPENIVCSGPFTIDAWEAKHRIQLKKNSYYQRVTGGNLENIDLYFEMPSLENYLNDQLDLCRVDEQADILRRYPENTFLLQYLTTYFLAFLCQHPPFNQKLIRQAFAQSINRQELVRQVWSDVQRPALGGFVPPGMPGHSPEIGLPFDPAAARLALQKAGVQSPTDLPPLTLAAMPWLRTTPAYLQESWRKHLQVEVKVVENMPIDELADQLIKGAVQLVILGWDAEYPDPDSMLRIPFHSLSPNNLFGWQHNQFDEIVERAAALTDQQLRLNLYHQADKILITEDSAVVPLYYSQGYAMIRPGYALENAGKVVRGGFFKLKNITIS